MENKIKIEIQEKKGFEYTLTIKAENVSQYDMMVLEIAIDNFYLVHNSNMNKMSEQDRIECNSYRKMKFISDLRTVLQKTLKDANINHLIEDEKTGKLVPKFT